ncbi:MAG: hypothetical protein L3K19_00785 [Thermoplasmata archaeon]|nr:hypothetical protein [Thermoplasmata archaeon]
MPREIRRNVRPRPLPAPALRSASRAFETVLLILAIGALSSGAGPLTPIPGSPPAPLPAGTGMCGGSGHNPSALQIPGSDPSSNIRSGGSVAVTYSVAAANASNGVLPVTVYVPSVTAVFPTTPTGSLTLFTPSQTLTLNGVGWSSSVSVTHVKTLASAVTFSTSKPSWISTQRIAVMASASYGQLNVEFRWHWSETTSAGANRTNGSWSVPRANASPPELPSILLPAPYVPLLRTSGTNVAAGANFTAELGGAVDNTSFRVVVEFPTNGTEITSRWESTAAGATTFNATARMAYAGGGALPSGHYLVHIHDHCQAIVHSIPVSVP